MKKFALALFIFCAGLSAATITLSESYVNIGPAPIDGYYYDSASSVKMTIDGKSELYAGIDQPLTSDEGYRLPENSLQWKIYWNDGGNIQPNYLTSDFRPYRLGQEKIIDIESNVTIELGHGINRIPSVQPAGIYRTVITFTLVDAI